MPKKNEVVPRVKVRKNATLKEIYAQLRKEFSAADLQKYTEIEPMVPADQVLADLEAIHVVDGPNHIIERKGRQPVAEIVHSFGEEIRLDPDSQGNARPLCGVPQLGDVLPHPLERHRPLDLNEIGRAHV